MILQKVVNDADLRSTRQEGDLELGRPERNLSGRCAMVKIRIDSDSGFVDTYDAVWGRFASSLKHPFCFPMATRDR
jgi:hypothetical protein